MFLPQGFEDLAAITIIDVFGWTHIHSHLISIHLKTCAFHSHVVGKFGTMIKVDHTITENILDYRSFDTYRAFVLPGGFHDAGFDEVYSAAIHQIATRIYGNKGSLNRMPPEEQSFGGVRPVHRCRTMIRVVDGDITGFLLVQ